MSRGEGSELASYLSASVNGQAAQLCDTTEHSKDESQHMIVYSSRYSESSKLHYTEFRPTGLALRLALL